MWRFSHSQYAESSKIYKIYFHNTQYSALFYGSALIDQSDLALISYIGFVTLQLPNKTQEYLFLRHWGRITVQVFA